MKWLLTFLLSITLLVLLGVMFHAARMEVVYMDMLLGEPLPKLTQWVFSYGWPLTTFTLFTGVVTVGITLAFYGRPIASVLIALQWAVTLFLLFITSVGANLPLYSITFSLQP